MSELIDNAKARREVLKHLILQLHKGSAPDAVKKQLAQLLGKVPYADVLLTEQALINEGFPSEEIMKLCDLHSAAMRGNIDMEGAKTPPPGHPVHTFQEENRALQYEIDILKKLYGEYGTYETQEENTETFMNIRSHFNALTDVDKHYRRKEELLFSYLEKHGVTGPSTVMWGKDDEARQLLDNAIEKLKTGQGLSTGEFASFAEQHLKPATDAIEEMIFKEENILFPMSLDNLSEEEWYAIYRQSLEIGFCLYDPQEEWKPEAAEKVEAEQADENKIQLPSGSMTPAELNAILNTIPFDLTFVDKEDRVRYFTRGKERIFSRSRAILGRKVQLCHPPHSVHIVQQILDDFHSGKEDHSAFWITMKGRFISIEYFALRGEKGEYLGTLEVSQDLTEKRRLEGEQRLLKYVQEGKINN